MAKMTVYIPDDLKARMDRVGSRGESWSGVCTRALEAKLDEIEGSNIQGEMDMQSVVSRLRGSLRNTENATRQRGYKVGYRWAAMRAEVPVLEAMENLPEDFFLSNTAINAYNYAEMLCQMVFEDEDSGRPNVEFLLSIEDAKLANNRDYMEGFVEGALALWGEAKVRL